jgi:hypothetical protein
MAAREGCFKMSALGATGQSSYCRRNALVDFGKPRHLSEYSTAKYGRKPNKLQYRVARTRVNGCKLLEFGRLQRPPWMRRVLVHRSGSRLFLGLAWSISSAERPEEADDLVTSTPAPAAALRIVGGSAMGRRLDRR